MIFSIFTTLHAAETPYTTLVDSLPGIEKTTTLSSYLPAVFNLSMGIAAVLAFVMITFGGIMYATSDAISGKSQGKEYVTNAIWGLLLVIGAWVILNTINPKILHFDLSIPKPNIPTAPTVTAVTPPCSGCQTLSLLKLPTNASSASGSVSSELGARLTALSINLGGLPWAVTEAWPPEPGLHVDPCHASATCVDAKPINQNPSSINAFWAAAQKSNLGGFYEVATQAEKDSLLKGYPNGQPPVPPVTAPILVNPKATAPHFHIKLQ